MRTEHRCRYVAAALGLAMWLLTPAIGLAQPRVAVMNFENNSTWRYWGDNLGAAAADELVTQLLNTGSYRMIERSQLAAVLAEQDLGASGAVDSSTAARIGQLLGAQLILTGSITQFSIETVSAGFRGIGGSRSKAETVLDVRLVDTTTGEILMAENGEGEKTWGGGFFKSANVERDFDAGVAQEALRPAIEQVTATLASQADRFASMEPVAPAAQIVGVNDGSFYINQGENLDITVGQRYEVIRVIDEIKDANGTVLDRITDRVGVIEVTRVLSQSAICTVVEGEAREGDAIQPL
jgi:curli biogenesis system outer membrane secretion channel CsgG